MLFVMFSLRAITQKRSVIIYLKIFASHLLLTNMQRLGLTILSMGLLSLIPRSSSFPDGAPVGTCDTFMPMHHTKDGKRVGPQPEKNKPPIQILLNATSIKAGDTVEVSIKSNDNASYKGFILQVQDVNKGTSVGTIQPVSVGTHILQCKSPGDTLTHSDPFDKTETVLYWKSPLFTNFPRIQVRATIVEKYDLIWTNVTSQTIAFIEDDDSVDTKTLGMKWLKQVVSTVEKLSDPIALEQEIEARFQKGFNGVVDKEGRFIVQYVLDILPFEDNYPGTHKKPDHDPSLSHGEEMLSFKHPENTARKTLSNSSHMSAEYINDLIKAVMKGDPVIAEELERILENEDIDLSFVHG
ncbi:hypothetical protein CHS0354_001759 [Potamilus streckersoni]|uniref:Reelin domain-containing protein n=1 Tax=Potamilus streckersoni TaxID=2493646 RepID=A0AAE0VX98_9BIVA|nr:hypothetical protein CHS0354_001759 [Potamilus streckersoni]